MNAVNNAIKDFLGISYVLDVYEEHALSKTSSSKAMAYVGITQDEKQLYWGVSSDEDIIRASIDALEHAVNHMIEIKGRKSTLSLSKISYYLLGGVLAGPSTTYRKVR